MRNTKLIFYCLLLLVAACAQKNIQGTVKKASDQSTALRVLCYNIHHANPPSKPGVIDVEAIAKVISQQTPDIVALQEVDIYTNRSGKTLNQASELARLSGMPYYFFAKAIDHDGGEYGVAILSKYPMENMKNTALPTAHGTNGEHRTLAIAQINLPDKKKIIFACTHLDAQKADTNRFLQINRIVEIMQQEKLPVVIAGDLNATPSTRIINRLDEYFTRSCLVKCGFTVPVINPFRTIDFIAFRPADKFIVAEHTIIDEQYASDHLPVKVVMQVK